MKKPIILTLVLFVFIISCSEKTGVSASADGSLHIGVITQAGKTYALQRLNDLASDLTLLNSVGLNELTYEQINSDISPAMYKSV